MAAGQAAGSPVLYPTRASGSARLGKLPDSLVPRARVAAALDALEVALGREQADALRSISRALGQPPAEGSPAAGVLEPPASVLPPQVPTSCSAACKRNFVGCLGYYC